MSEEKEEKAETNASEPLKAKENPISKVAHLNFSKESNMTKEKFFDYVKRVMDLADYKQYIKGKKVFLKVNLLSDQLVPGQCTSPWFVEAVVKVLKDDYELFIGDAEVATAKQVETAARLWGTKDICKKYKIPFINLSKQPLMKVDVGGEIFKEMEIPRILLDVDCIVTLPVLKSHNVTKMTFSLKNQWGCLTKVRQQYHLKAHKCIAEINKFLNVVFAVGDATVCMEKDGPRTGTPIVVNSVLASNDRVALDTVGCKLMRLDADEVGFLANAERLGVGTKRFKVVGDPIRPVRFAPALAANHPIVKWELRLRKVPVINYILFKTPLFHIPAWIASHYNSHVWYYLSGIKHRQKLMVIHRLYREEFQPLIDKI